MSNEKELALIAEKRQQWAGLGESMHTKEMQLQAMKQKALNDFTLPTKFDQVPEALNKLKDLKKAKKDISQFRITEITSKFDPFFTRVSANEKELVPKIELLTTTIISIQQAEEKRKKALKEKEDEAGKLKEYVLSYLSTTIADFKLKIQTQVLFAYEWALTNKVTPEKIEEYISKCADKFKVTDFTRAVEIPSWVKLTPSEESEKIVSESFVLDSNDFIDSYRQQLKEKFATFDIDFLNAEQALEKAQEEIEKEAATIETEKAEGIMSAKLETMSVPASSIWLGVKDLKKKFELINPDNTELVKCFIANAKELLPYIKAKSFYDQLARVIEEHKNKNNDFTPSNLKFKTVDKL